MPTRSLLQAQRGSNPNVSFGDVQVVRLAFDVDDLKLDHTTACPPALNPHGARPKKAFAALHSAVETHLGESPVTSNRNLPTLLLPADCDHANGTP